MPTFTYAEAMRRGRAAAGQLSATEAAAIEQALRDYAGTLGRELRSLPLSSTERAIRASRSIILSEAEQLHSAIATAVSEGRQLSYSQVLAIWQDAGAQAAALAPTIAGAALGAIRAPALTLAGAYEALGGAAHTWRTSLTGYIQNAATDADNIVRSALLEGISVDELALRLRPYVEGAEPFHAAFGGQGLAAVRARVNQLNLARGPAQREGGRKLRNNAQRIAYSEIWNARAEAEVQHFIVDPLVYAVQWALAPNRGSLEGPDICDVLALNDFFGLGPGVFPLNAVPFPPHPWCRCLRIPLLRDWRQAGQPKPMPGLRPDAAKNAILFDANRYYPINGRPPMTAAQADRLRAELGAVLQATQNADIQAGITALLEGNERVVAAAASTGPGPLGKVISTLVSLRPRQRGAAVLADALAAIDELHGDGTLPPISLEYSKLGSGTFGQYMYSPFNKPIGIQIAREVQDEGGTMLTVYHEVGHWLDHFGLGEGQMASAGGDVFLDSWHKAVENSAAVKALKVIQGRPSSWDSLRFVNYLLSPEELWARSYAQWVAVRGARPQVLAALQRKQDKGPLEGFQWSAEDFAPIGAAIDQLMEKLGWRRP